MADAITDPANYMIAPLIGNILVMINKTCCIKDDVVSGCAESKMDRKEAEETVLDAARNMAQFISENLEKKKREWHKAILKEENIATLESKEKM